MNSDKLSEYLKSACVGSKNAAGSAALETMLHCSGNELRKQVNRLRRKNVPIGSGKNGYFYARNAGEVYATIRQLRQMSAGLEAAIQGLERALDSFGDSV